MRKVGIGLIAASLTVAGCSSSTTEGQGSGGTAPGSFAANASQSCEIYESGQNVRIQINDGGVSDTLCQQLIKSLSAGGSFWTESPQSDPGDLQTVCIMRNGSALADILDDDAEIEGTALCSSFVQSGWTEDTQAEQQQASAAAAASASAASAAAAASASSAAAEQQQQEQNNAVATLNQDGNNASSDAGGLASDVGTLEGDISTMNSDVGQTNTDLQTVYSDSRNGGNSDGTTCADASSVAADADSVSADADSIQSDLDTLTHDIQSARRDVATLRADLSTVENLIPGYAGGANALGPSNVTQISQTINSAVGSAISHANSYIDTANGYVATAYGYAKTASGVDHCATYAAPTSSPIKHLS